LTFTPTAGEYDISSYVRNPEVFAVKNGFVEALQGPGLGIEIDEDLVKKVALTTKPWALKGFVGEDGGYREW
jgi:galactonate dehydratase